MQKHLNLIAGLLLAGAILHGPSVVGGAGADELAAPAAALPKNSVGSRQIKDGQVKPKDLSNAAKPVAVTGSENESDSTGGLNIAVNTEVRKVSLKVPGRGAIVATGSMWFRLPVNGRMYCIVHDESTFKFLSGPDSDLSIFHSSPTQIFESLSQTRVFPVDGKGAYDIYLLCTDDGDGTPLAVNPSLVAFFVPQVQGIVSESTTEGTGAAAGRGVSRR